MDSKSIRYQNTRLLVDSVGGVSNFAEKIGKGQSQTSQFAGTNPIKGIGNKVAREIEEAFGMPYGWLDIPHKTIKSLDFKNTSNQNIKSFNSNDLFQSLELLNIRIQGLSKNRELRDDQLKIIDGMISGINATIDSWIKITLDNGIK